MLILHAGILDSKLYVWGETPPQPASTSTKRRGRKPKAKTPVPEMLPYDAGREPLAQALRATGIFSGTGKQEWEQAFLWSPTVAGVPVASDPLIADPPESGPDAVILHLWKITVLPLPSLKAVEFLCSCMDKVILAPGIVIGKDLAFLSRTVRFAGALVARQQFLPSVARKDGFYFAVWEPVFAGPDRDRLAKLAGAMPSSCRALSLNPVDPPSPSSLDTLISFIGSVLDKLVRISPPEGSKRTRSPVTRTNRGSTKKSSGFSSIHDHWLNALQTPDGRMESDGPEPAQLFQQVKEWLRPIAVTASAAFRLCFRLEEPEDNEDDTGKSRRREDSNWNVRYLLQPTDDPSLLVPAELVWNPKGRKAAILKRGGFDAKEYMVSALGQASGICPKIESSLRTNTPEGYGLDTPGAYDFLIQKAWALEQAGFGVLLPAWWTLKGTKNKLVARAKVKSPKMQGGGGLSLAEIVHFDWEAAIGGETLTLRELQALAKLKSPLVKIRGRWVELNPEEIQAALDFWKKKESGEATVREVIQMALGAQKHYGGLSFEGVVSATGWIKDMLAQLEGRAAFQELAPPGGFQGTLRPYQLRGYSWLNFLHRWGLGACLADDMGLGKTIQTLALIQRDRESNGKRPVLLICPMSVVNNWQKESLRFTPDLPVMIHHGATRTKGKTFKTEAKKHAVVISSYALLHRDFEILKTVPWAGVVLDEAQNIKNPETKQAKAARALQADYRIALTGTPVENNVGDLWSIMEFLNPGFLGTQIEFKSSFFIPIQANRDPNATDRLKQLTGPFVLRRLKTDKSIIADLPDKIEMKVFCTLTKEQASLYEAVVQDAAKALDSAEGIQRKGVVLATLSKLKQVCNHPAHFLGDNSSIPGRSGKLMRLTEMMEEIVQVGDRALIFSQFSEMGEILRRYLQDTFGREALFLHGGVSKKKRDHMVERFQAETGGPQIFILSLKAGGTGLNLTQASHVFHFDRWWNPAVENQATDRAFRIGQKQNVQVHKFICAGTLEERIDEMIESKEEISKGVVGTGEGWLTELSTSQLKDLFALGKNAVAE